MAAGHADFDALLSTTLDNYRDTLEDNLSTQVPLWHFLKENGRITKRGGAKVIEPLLYGSNTTSKTYSDYEALDFTPQEGITAAEFEWRQHAVVVRISGIEEAKNAGKYAVVDLLQAKVEQAEISAVEDFDVMFHGDGTGNTGKNFLGTDALIGDQSSAVTTVGGIDCTDPDNAWWRSYVDRTAGVLTIEDMTHAFHMASRNRVAPQYGETTLELFEAYNAQLQANQRFTDPKTAEAGFRNLVFQGVPLMWSDNIASGSVEFINPKFLRLNQLGDTWLKNGKFVEDELSDSKSSKILSYGQLSVSNRKLAGSRLEDRTA